MVLFVLVLLAAMHAGAAVRVADAVRQGEVLRIEVDEAAGEPWHASLGGRTVTIFPQPEGPALGLMPVAAGHRAGPAKLMVQDGAGSVVETRGVRIVDARFPTQNIVATPGMKSLTAEPGEREAIGALFRTVSRERHWSEPFVAPTPACANSPFGVQRLHNGKPSGNYHRGLDLRSPMSTPVRAAAAGVVRISRMFRLHGGTVGIDHGQGVTTLYIHLSKLIAAEGQRVEAGEVIGEVGSTGFSTGPHLHWQVSVNGVSVNPAQWTPSTKPCAQRPAPRKRKPRR